MARIVIENEKASGREGWTKHIIEVDTSKNDGRAFHGTFLQNGEHGGRKPSERRIIT